MASRDFWLGKEASVESNVFGRRTIVTRRTLTTLRLG